MHVREFIFTPFNALFVVKEVQLECECAASEWYEPVSTNSVRLTLNELVVTNYDEETEGAWRAVVPNQNVTCVACH